MRQPLSESRSQSGFTLVETLVALFILALVSSAGASLLIGATGAGKQVRAQEAEARQLDIAQSLIRQDIAAMSTRGVAPADGYTETGNLFGEAPRGELPFLRFVRSGWVNPANIEARSPLQAVYYSLREGDLIREAALRPDASQGTPVASRVLLTDVRGIQLDFVRGGVRSDFWNGAAGQALYVLPDLIEMRITFDTGVTLTIAGITGGRT